MYSASYHTPVQLVPLSRIKGLGNLHSHSQWIYRMMFLLVDPHLLFHHLTKFLSQNQHGEVEDESSNIFISILAVLQWIFFIFIEWLILSRTFNLAGSNLPFSECRNVTNRVTYKAKKSYIAFLFACSSGFRASYSFPSLQLVICMLICMCCKRWCLWDVPRGQ